MAGGVLLGARNVREGAFEVAFPLPPVLEGKASIQVTVEVSRTLRPEADPRELGLAFGSFEVR